MTFKAACIQLNSNDDPAHNLALVTALVKQSARKGATLVTTPENTLLMSVPGKGVDKEAVSYIHKTALPKLQLLAKELRIWLLIGSVPAPSREKNRYYNRSTLIDDQGKIACQYDKIHLFDVTLQSNEIYRESRRIKPGSALRIANTPLANIGFTICYDLRFPGLYRKLAHMGAEIITVPAAFTYVTGQAHWEVLLRARAIENGCYILAPAETGIHPGGRRTYGHSMIIDPWGKIIAQLGEEEGIILADIDIARVQEIRRRLPSLKHDRRLR